MTDTRKPQLSMERFAALVEAYGGELERFPAKERAAAKQLLLASPEARRIVEAARALDALLAASAEPTPSVELESMLARIPSMHAQDRRRFVLLPFRSRGVAILSAAAALLLGVLSGGALDLDRANDAPDAPDVVEVALGEELLFALGNDAAYEEDLAP